MLNLSKQIKSLFSRQLLQTVASSTILFSSLFFHNIYANDETSNTYGPVKTGESLWKIAEKTRPNKDISIEQLAYAIYKNNPKAFSSRNMNVIKKGAVLTIPENEAINKISSKEAKKKLTEHTHAIEVLRADAKQLQAAKNKQAKYKKQIIKRQKDLAKYRHKSKAWNRQYLRLVESKRNYAKSRRQVAKLKSLLLEKATLKYAKVKAPDAEEIAAIDKVNDKLGNIQSSLDNLNQSNNTLVKKTEQLDIMSERLKVLEQELGKNDEIVIQMQKNLEELKLAVEEQTLQNKKQNEQIEAIEKAQQTVALSVDETIANKVQEVVEKAQQTAAIKVDETISTKMKEVVEQAQRTAAATVDEAITTKVKEVVKEAQKSAAATVDEAITTKVKEVVEEAQKSAAATVDESITNKVKEVVATAITEQMEKTEQVSKTSQTETVPTPKQDSKQPTETLLTENSTEEKVSTAEKESNKNAMEVAAIKEQQTTLLKDPVNTEKKVIDSIAVTEKAETKTKTQDTTQQEKTIAKTSDKAIEETSEKAPNTFIADDETRYKTYADYFVEEITQSENPVIKTAENQSALLKTRIPNDVETFNQKAIQQQALVNRQRQPLANNKDYQNSGSLMENHKEKIILFGGVLNGLILLFLVFRFFIKQQETIEIESEDRSDKPKSYQSWQDRVKPRHLDN